MLSMYFWHTRISFPKDLVKIGEGLNLAGWGNNSAPINGEKQGEEIKKKETRRQETRIQLETLLWEVRRGREQRKKTEERVRDHGENGAPGMKALTKEARAEVLATKGPGLPSPVQARSRQQSQAIP